MYNPLSLPICLYLYLYLYHYHTSRHPSTIHIKPQSPEPISHLLPPHPPQRYISSLSPYPPIPPPLSGPPPITHPYTSAKSKFIKKKEEK